MINECDATTVSYVRNAIQLVRPIIHSIGLKVYRKLPPEWRDSVVYVAYHLFAPLFKGMPHFETWRHYRNSSRNLADRKDCSGLSTMFVAPNCLTPLADLDGKRIAIHVHLYYVDLLREVRTCLYNMPFAFDLFVSVASEEDRKTCLEVLRRLPRVEDVSVRVVLNRGRDVAPMICEFGKVLASYDYICHIHGKKSLYNAGASAGWREYLFNALMGSEKRIRRIFALFEENPDIGLVYPQNFFKMPYMANTWLESRGVASAVGARLGVQKLPDGYFDFPLGTMFWARKDAVGSLFTAGFTLDEFAEEAGQTDGTLAHCLERMLGLIGVERGYRPAILRDDLSPSWSRWRFEQYFSRSKTHIESLIANPAVEVVLFDIFDTLLTRPLVQPSAVQWLVARRLQQPLADSYIKYRSIAEATVRKRLGRDVCMGDICRELSVLSGMPENEVSQAFSTEEEVEAGLVSPRDDVVALYRHALLAKKRVVIASDMYLPKALLERMLRGGGVDGWEELFVSGDVGLRKDTGGLYLHIIEKLQVESQAVLVVGDNERSDFQIPHRLGMRYCHLLKSVEVGKTLPGLGDVVLQESAPENVGGQLSVGIILERLYNSLFYKSFYPAFLPATTPFAIGYAVLGPVCLAFCQWLGQRAKDRGVGQLFFLSREGEFLQQIYERLRLRDAGLPESSYLVVSRRALTVPAIQSPADALDICRSRYFPNPLPDFFLERFGVQLDQSALSVLYSRGLWERGRLLEVGDDGNVSHLEPVVAHLWELIRKQASEERSLAAQYLDEVGVSSVRDACVVDIGYSGTIQKAIMQISGRAMGGLYMLTSAQAASLARTPGVVIEACFGELISPGPEAPLIFRQSFLLEKLLSADQGQLLRYVRDGGGVAANLRTPSPEEKRAIPVRSELREGAGAFVSRALHLSCVCNSWCVPPATARTIFEAYSSNLSPADQRILASLACDDYYCGRGVGA